jgi:DNA-directed RNA polymerase subunit H (RpoH/RPB5)
VRHIYLDQNKWVALTRARAGRNEEAHLIEILEAARDAVCTGNASFPLSAQHYYETQHRGDRGSRGDLAQTMLSFSRDDAIAPPHVVVPHEIEVALINQLRLPDKQLPEIQISVKARTMFSTRTVLPAHRLMS